MQIKVSSKKIDKEREAEKQLPQKTKTSILRQLVAGCLANLTLINAGLQFSWPAVSLPILQNGEAVLRVTSSEGAWIVCALSMGACLGPVISAFLVNNLGRKWTLLLTVVPSSTCWILVYFAETPKALIAGRFIGGIGIGATYATVPMYIGEIAETRIRGALGCILCIMVATGNLITYTIGPWISIPMLALFDIGPSLIFACTFVWMPETPYYYLLKQQFKRAEIALIWLRGRNDVMPELQEMYNLTRDEQCNKGGMKEIFTVAGNRWATLIVFVAIGAQQMSGLFALFAYSGLIFAGTSSTVSPDILVGLSGVVTLTFNIITFFIIDRIGRKPLLLASSMGTTCCLLFIAIYFHSRHVGADVDAIYWLPIVSLLAFFAFYAIGLGPIPYAIVSEIYPMSVKAWATMIVSIYGSLLSVAVSKIYQIVADEWGEHVIFYSFATIEAIFSILVSVIVFETKGKSFEEIQARLNGKCSNKFIVPPDNKIKPFFINSEENLATTPY